MHLPQAYRSLPRPSSLIKPSHPPIGVFAPDFFASFNQLLSNALKLYANIGKAIGFFLYSVLPHIKHICRLYADK
jgi:hypothetical protein